MNLPGEDIVIRAPGPVTIRGEIVALSGADARAVAPSIIIEVDGVLVLDGAVLRAAHGKEGASTSVSGFAVGSDGESGGNVRIRAHKIIARDTVVFAGDGGRGGEAFAIGEPNAEARAGDGGAGGVVVIESIVEGVLTTRDGRGGDGGEAVAEGQDGESCKSLEGRGAESDARGPAPITGQGQTASAAGTDGKCGPVDGEGGKGGDAIAYGGAGGVAMDGSGGRGGDAVARAGRGGDGADACFTSVDLARASGIVRAGKGGTGGAVRAFGGAGGNGTLGGRGGDAIGSGSGGHGGNATAPILAAAGGTTIPLRSYDVESMIVGGDGGFGISGGGGGGALSVGEGGGGGGHCGPLEYKGLNVPAAPSLVAALVALALALVARRAGPSSR